MGVLDSEGMSETMSARVRFTLHSTAIGVLYTASHRPSTALSPPFHCIFTAFPLSFHCIFLAFSLPSTVLLPCVCTPLHCISFWFTLPFHCLSLRLHCLSFPFHCLCAAFPLPFLVFPLPSTVLFLCFHWLSGLFQRPARADDRWRWPSPAGQTVIVPTPYLDPY